MTERKRWQRKKREREGQREIDLEERNKAGEVKRKGKKKVTKLDKIETKKSINVFKKKIKD